MVLCHFTMNQDWRELPQGLLRPVKKAGLPVSGLAINADQMLWHAVAVPDLPVWSTIRGKVKSHGPVSSMFADTVKEQELLELDHEVQLNRLFHEEGVRLFASEAVCISCDCSR